IVIGGSNKNEDLEYKTAQIERGMLIQSVSATGKVESSSETDLNFKIAGKLGSIFVSPGEQVSQGQILARLTSLQQQSAVTSAQAKLAQAQADLDSVIQGSSNEEVAIVQAKLAQAQANLNSYEAALLNAYEIKNENILSYKEQALDEAQEARFLAADSLEDIIEILDGDKEVYLRTYITSYFNADTDYNTALVSYNSFLLQNLSFDTTNSVEDLVDYLDQIYNIQSKVNTALNASFSLLSNLDPVGTITQTEIDAWKVTIIADQSSVSSSITALQTAKSNLLIKSIEYNNSIEEAQLSIEQSETALAVAQAELDSTLAEPRGFEIDLQNAKVKMAQADLQAAYADLSEYTLTSPLDGVVTKVEYQLGEYISAQESVVSIISENNLEIEVDVPESDITKIKVEDISTITLDAFNEDEVFTSHITFIDPAETIINDVVYYKIKLTFDEKDPRIKSGMTANVDITTASKDDVLYIPLRAVIEKNNIKYIRYIENGEIKEQEVTTGLRGDGGLVEVLTGVSEGQEIITYIKNGE
ncbi:efflux RND transporter periplasmic adaptor subunit, partial [bacterium]|nr:efflux RND transporter periplasmic adaptor subunit [bacterium]